LQQIIKNQINYQLISVGSARTCQNYEGRENRTQSILYWFTLPQGLRPLSFAPQAKKVPINQWIVHLQSTKQLILSVRIKKPTKLIDYSPQPQSIQQTHKANFYNPKPIQLFKNFKKLQWINANLESNRIKKGWEKLPDWCNRRGLCSVFNKFNCTVQ